MALVSNVSEFHDINKMAKFYPHFFIRNLTCGPLKTPKNVKFQWTNFFTAMSCDEKNRTCHLKTLSH